MRCLILISFLMSACGMVQHKRHIVEESQEWQNYVEQNKNEWEKEAKRQLGLEHKTPLTRSERSKIYWRIQVLKKEAEMKAPSLKSQYYKYQPYFINDRQRLAFLKIDDLTARQAWLNEYLDYKPKKYEDKVEAAINEKDLVPYMTKDAVVRSWGKPDNVEGSGNSMFGNERWKYTFFLDTADGEVTENRYLYFERGKLVGWETLED